MNKIDKNKLHAAIFYSESLAIILVFWTEHEVLFYKLKKIDSNFYYLPIFY